MQLRYLLRRAITTVLLSLSAILPALASDDRFIQAPPRFVVSTELAAREALDEATKSYLTAQNFTSLEKLYRQLHDPDFDQSYEDEYKARHAAPQPGPQQRQVRPPGLRRTAAVKRAPSTH